MATVGIKGLTGPGLGRRCVVADSLHHNHTKCVEWKVNNNR